MCYHTRTMSKKDYIKLAKLLSFRYWQYRTTFGLSPIENVILDLSNDICEMLEKDNPNFDKKKFMEAVYKNPV